MIDILLGQFGGWIIAAVSFIAGAVGLYIKGRRDARRGAKLDAARDNIKSHEVRNDVEADIDRSPDPKQRLRRNWRR